MVSARRTADTGDRLSPNPNVHKDERRLIKMLPQFKHELEALIRNAVREEVNQVLSPHVPFQRSEVDPFVTRIHHLCIVSKLPNRIFTGNHIDSEGAQPIKVVLQDATTGTLISDGPLSSMRLEIVVLHGDFKAEERTTWTHNEFNDSVLLPRQGKRPLLIGDRYITLKNGAAFFNQLSISDNSSWVRSRKFRLGVRVAHGPVSYVEVREAVTGAFAVRDKRGESYQKHPTPSLEDEVWRLYKIAKDGIHSKKLAANGVYTVKDFLRRYHTDESSLRSILRVPNNAWNKVIEHAKSCTLDDDDHHYSYFDSGEGVGLVFDCVLNVVGVTYGGQNYWPMETLTITQKSQVQRLKLYAYANRGQLVHVDGLASSNMITSPCETINVPSNRSSLTNLHQLDIQDQGEKDTNFSYPECPLPYVIGVEHSHGTTRDQMIRVSSSMSDMSELEHVRLPINEPPSSSGVLSGNNNMFNVQGSGSLMASTNNLHWYIASSSSLS